MSNFFEVRWAADTGSDDERNQTLNPIFAMSLDILIRLCDAFSHRRNDVEL